MGLKCPAGDASHVEPNVSNQCDVGAGTPNHRHVNHHHEHVANIIARF